MDLEDLQFSIDDFVRFKAGEESAFRIIFDYYQPLLFRRICQFCPNLVEAEEITQEIFVQLFLKRSDIKDIASIYPFLYVVAKRMAISSFRKKIVQKHYLQEQINWEEGSVYLEEDLEVKELQSILDDIIQELPPQQQLIYRMNKVQELSYEEIANQSGLSKLTVRNHLHLACKFVRHRMDKILFIIFLLKI